MDLGSARSAVHSDGRYATRRGGKGLGAAQATVEVAFGLDGLYCPKCGRVIFDEQISWDESECPHVRFVEDWVGDLWVAPPESVPEEQRFYLRWLSSPTGPEWGDDPLDTLCRYLPASCLVLTVAEPGRGVGSAGATVTVGLDLDPRSGSGTRLD